MKTRSVRRNRFGHLEGFRWTVTAYSRASGNVCVKRQRRLISHRCSTTWFSVCSRIPERNVKAPLSLNNRILEENYLDIHSHWYQNLRKLRNVAEHYWDTLCNYQSKHDDRYLKHWATETKQKLGLLKFGLLVILQEPVAMPCALEDGGFLHLDFHENHKIPLELDYHFEHKRKTQMFAPYLPSRRSSLQG